FTPKNDAELQKNIEISDRTTVALYREPNEHIEKVDIPKFALFLENVKDDYQNGDTQLQTALNKFTEHPVVNVRSGSIIRVQVEFAKRRKLEGSGRKRILPPIINKENLDP
ncbi:20309_t:CDS:2, partial [Gigaspora rosea]